LYTIVRLQVACCRLRVPTATARATTACGMLIACRYELSIKIKSISQLHSRRRLMYEFL